MATTLADHMRSLSDDALGALLRQRPDLVVPVPADIPTLAARAQTRMSVARALDRLDELTLCVLDAARLTLDPEDGTTSVGAILALVTASTRAAAASAGMPAGTTTPLAASTIQPPAPEQPTTPASEHRDPATSDNVGTDGADNGPIRAALHRLRELSLLYGSETALRLSGGVEEACTPYPAGLGRPAAVLDPATAALCADPARLRRTLLAAPPAARAVLDRLAAGPPVGTIALGSTEVPGSANTAATAGSAGAGSPADRASAAGSVSGPATADTVPTTSTAGTASTARTTGTTGTAATSRTTGTAATSRTSDTAATSRTTGTAGSTDAAYRERQPDDAEPVDGNQNPVRWLVTHRLLVPIPPTGDAQGAVELPREIGLLLRRDSGPLGRVRRTAPPVEAPVRKQRAVDSAGAGQAMEAVRQLDALLEALAADPCPVLRTGGLGGRDVRRLARVSGVDPRVAPLLLEISYAAGLAGEVESSRERVGRPAPTSHLVPTFAYDHWRTSTLSGRWAHLAECWLAMTRQPGLVRPGDDRGRPVNVLSPEVERAGAPATRRAVLGALNGLPAGTAPDPDALLALLRWQEPRRARSREAVARETLDDAARLGVTGLSALTSYGRRLLAEEEQPPDEDPFGLRTDVAETIGAIGAARVLDALLPEPVDHVLVQADLTVVVPGPPEPALAAELELIAEHESAGGASVYRLTQHSVRRAMDAGYAAEDLHAMFKRRSRTPVPQGLTYLIDDVARKHGGLRVGSAGAYLRSDDEALLAEVLTDRRLADLALRRLAPTVLATRFQSSRLLSALREAGFAPVPEDSGGAVVLARPKTRRAPARGVPARVTDPLAPPNLTPPRVQGIVEQIRRGDAAARTARRASAMVHAAHQPGTGRPTAVQAHTQALATLQQAVRDRARVWVGYVDPHGTPVSRLVRPVSMSAGYLRAEDERTETQHTFALHRITAAVLDE